MEFVNDVKLSEKIDYHTFMNMEQNEQIKYAFDNFKLREDFSNFTLENFTLEYSNIIVIKFDNKSWNNDARYLVENKLDNKRYYIEFELFEDYYIVCRDHCIYNSFITKYPLNSHENFSKLHFDAELTKKFNFNGLAELEKYFANKNNLTNETDLTNETNLEYLLSNLPTDDYIDFSEDESSIFSEIYGSLIFRIGNQIYQFKGIIETDGLSEGEWI